jgi:hypothetical protein
MTYAWIIAEIILAYAFIDAFSGVYHALTDNGLNIKHQRDIFVEHHEINTMHEYGWAHLLIALPMIVAGVWLGSVFLTASGVIGIFGQMPHYYAHRNSRSPLVHHFVRLLQLTGIIISPQYHATHHDGKFNRNYCIVSGWNDWWINRVVALFRREALPA